MAVPPPIEPVPRALTDGLARPDAYPDDPSAAPNVECRQTHISHVFLTGTRVYKLRKAVRPGFLDFGTRQARNADCEREVRLNRRLAPDVYLGIAPITVASGRVQVGPVAETAADPGCEHCVVMRRLPDGRDALSLLSRGLLTTDQLDTAAEVIADFHARQRLGRPAPFAQEEWVARLSQPVEDNFALLADVTTDDQVTRLASAARQFLRAHADRFDVRRRDGRVVDGHGDLHLAHVWFEDDTAAPVFIDCIEFGARLRQIDAASEVAFLAMDLWYRGEPALAERFLRRYAVASGDLHLYAVVDYYISYRAGVRAKVAAMAAGERELPPDQREAARTSASRHLDLALEALERRDRAALVVMTGVVGSGKSTAANVVADTVGSAGLISSDWVRKQQAGITPTTRIDAPVDHGLYSSETTQAVYETMRADAQGVIASGRVAILDATFSDRSQRAAVTDFAQRRGIPLLFVETRCPASTTLERLAARQEARSNPSDAGPEFYETSVARYARLGAAEGPQLSCDTGRAGWSDDLRARVQTWLKTW